MCLIKEICSQPLRFGIFKDNKKQASICRKTMKAFDLHKGQTCDSKLVESVSAFEMEVLASQMEIYLSRCERSPGNLDKWFSRRKLTKTQTEELSCKAREDNFLSEQRFVEAYMANQRLRATKPLWRLKGELKQKGVQDKYLTDLDYDDISAIELTLKSSLRFRNLPPEKIIKKLQTRGFSYADIKKAMNIL